MGKLKDTVEKYVGIFLTEQRPAKVKTHLYQFVRDISWEYGEAVINVFRHDGAGYHVTGTQIGIDMLRQSLIKDELVKALVVYHRNPDTGELDKHEQLNYTTLKEMRANGR